MVLHCTQEVICWWRWWSFLLLPAGFFCGLIIDTHWRTYDGDDIGTFPNIVFVDALARLLCELVRTGWFGRFLIEFACCVGMISLWTRVSNFRAVLCSTLLDMTMVCYCLFVRQHLLPSSVVLLLSATGVLCLAIHMGFMPGMSQREVEDPTRYSISFFGF